MNLHSVLHQSGQEETIILETPPFHLSTSPPRWLWKQYFKNHKSADVRGLTISHLNLDVKTTPPVSIGRFRQHPHYFFYIQSQSGLKIYDEYLVSCEATGCWYGASNQRSVASESFSVDGPMSPSWILNVYQRRWQACQRPESSTSSSCVVLYQATKIHRAIPNPALRHSLLSTVCPLVLQFLLIIFTHRQRATSTIKRPIKRANQSMSCLKIELKHS